MNYFNLKGEKKLESVAVYYQAFYTYFYIDILYQKKEKQKETGKIGPSGFWC